MSPYIDGKTIILITKTDSGISKIDESIKHECNSGSACVIQIQKRARRAQRLNSETVSQIDWITLYKWKKPALKRAKLYPCPTQRKIKYWWIGFDKSQFCLWKSVQIPEEPFYKSWDTSSNKINSALCCDVRIVRGLSKYCALTAPVACLPQPASRRLGRG